MNWTCRREVREEKVWNWANTIVITKEDLRVFKFKANKYDDR